MVIIFPNFCSDFFLFFIFWKTKYFIEIFIIILWLIMWFLLPLFCQDTVLVVGLFSNKIHYYQYLECVVFLK